MYIPITLTTTWVRGNTICAIDALAQAPATKGAFGVYMFEQGCGDLLTFFLGFLGLSPCLSINGYTGSQSEHRIPFVLPDCKFSHMIN